MSEVEELESLKKRYQLLADQRTKAEALLENARQELKKLQDEAAERFGTSNLAELEAKLTQMERENLEKRRAYQQQLDGIEAKLKEVEDKFQTP